MDKNEQDMLANYKIATADVLAFLALVDHSEEFTVEVSRTCSRLLNWSLRRTVPTLTGIGLTGYTLPQVLGDYYYTLIVSDSPLIIPPTSCATTEVTKTFIGLLTPTLTTQRDERICGGGDTPLAEPVTCTDIDASNSSKR
jgi:hypothetical protein